MRLRNVVDYLYLFQTLIPMPVQSPLPATKMLQPIRAPLFLDRSKMRLFNTMTINKIRCFNCGNLFRVDLDRPEKTGMRKSEPDSTYGEFTCARCKAVCRIVLPRKSLPA